MYKVNCTKEAWSIKIYKIFWETNNEPETIKGKTLNEAIVSAGYDPTIIAVLDHSLCYE